MILNTAEWYAAQVGDKGDGATVLETIKALGELNLLADPNEVCPTPNDMGRSPDDQRTAP
jgi:hypothetical protein